MECRLYIEKCTRRVGIIACHDRQGPFQYSQ